MKRIAVFGSGNGTNFEAIVNACKAKKINAEVVLMVCDKPKAYIIERAKNQGIKAFVFKASDYASKKDYETEIVHLLQELKVNIICLAGYMRILGPDIISAYANKILNIHPSLLPAFKGSPHAIEDSYNYGVKVFGVTVHFVNMEVDGGKIVVQKAFNYTEGDTCEQVEEKIHALEHDLYIEAINKIL